MRSALPVFTTNLRLAFAALALSLAVGCGGGAGGGNLPDQHIGTTAVARQVSGDNLGQGSDFGILHVDSNAPSPVVSNQFIHITPVQAQTPRIVPNFSSDDDLINHGGKVTPGATQHNLYVNCSSSCWASPAGFEIRLGSSGMIHILDQYRAVGTYDYCCGGQVAYSKAHSLKDSDMQKIISAFINKNHTATGYTEMYNVFLMKGVDECMAAPHQTECYSPDKPVTNVFCAYHSAADFSGVGHVLYTVEPYQDVQGCRAKGHTPNGVLADSTDSILSHEIFEVATDPDGKTWFNENGDEIGDICRNLYQNVTLRDRIYDIQGEYSNRIHDCAW